MSLDSTPLTAATPPRVLLFGAVPPPFGGVQAHTVRLLAWLRAHGYDARLADMLHRRLGQATLAAPEISPCANSFLAIARQIAEVQPDLVHSHVYRWRVTLALGALARFGTPGGRRPRTVVTVHGTHFFRIIPAPLRRAVAAALRRVDLVLAVNVELQRFLQQEVGVAAEKTAVPGAFLPPRQDELDPGLLPADLRQFAAAHRPFLVSNGAVASHDGADKYGIDVFIAAVAALRAGHPNLGAMFFVTANHEPARLQRLRAEVRRLGLDDCFRFSEGLPSLLPLVAAADATVRATNTDGDSLSIHESLLLGTPAVASDVVARPPLCRTFRSRDVAHLAEALSAALVAGRLPAARVAEVPHAGSAIVGHYRRLLDGATIAAATVG